MKKILIGLLAISSVAMASKGESSIGVRVGGDLGARYSKDIEGLSKNTDVRSTEETGTEFALEYYYEAAPNLNLGIGIGYQRHARRKANFYTIGNSSSYIDGGEYISIPVYVSAKINIPIEGNIKPYLKADLGYSINKEFDDIRVRGTDSKGNLNGNEERVEGKLENGLYAAGGLGIEFYKTIDVDLMMAITKARVYDKDSGPVREKTSNDYIRGVLSIGYKFNWN